MGSLLLWDKELLLHDLLTCFGILFQGCMFCNVANKIEFEFKFVDVSVTEMCL